MNRSRAGSGVLLVAMGGLLALALILLATGPSQAAGPWYVAPGGDDGNDCQSPGTACASMNGALAKPGFVLSDTVYVATGTYTGTGDEVVLLDKDVILSGGWDGTFTSQSGTSTIDGEHARRGMTVNGGVTASVGRFAVQNGSKAGTGSAGNGAGIFIEGILALNDCTVHDNMANNGGSGIYNTGTLTLNNSTVSGNRAGWSGGGFFNGGNLALNGSTVSENAADSRGGGIYNLGTLNLNGSTVRDNLADSSGGGIWIYRDTTTTLTNAIISGNTAGKSGGGISNGGAITLYGTSVSGNRTAESGGGISNGGTMTLYNSTVRDNSASGSGGGIWNEAALVLFNSTVSGNTANQQGGGIMSAGIFGNPGGSLALNNSTVSGNRAGYRGGGVRNRGTLVLNSSTVSRNTSDSSGGGIHSDGELVTLENTIVAGNVGDTDPDCSGDISTSSYSLIGDTSGCTFTPSTGDLTDVEANLGLLIGPEGVPWYQPLLSGSPAIDAGDPAGCTDDLGNPLATDQRGAPRIGRCDMGAYEYTTAGPAVSISAASGTPQISQPLFAFEAPLQAAVIDSVGTPVAGVMVAFAAPASGASGAFADSGTYTTTAMTGEGGVATAAIFTANGRTGSYTVTAKATGIETLAHFRLRNLSWYVAPGGDDADDCQAPTTPCATINGVLAKDSFAAGHTVLVASGSYTGTGDAVVVLDKDVTLSGGWSTGFTDQTGTSTIDGEEIRRAMTVNGGVTATVEAFTLQRGSAHDGAGIHNEGTLTLNRCTVGNNAGAYGGGIKNGGTLTLNDSTVSRNTVSIHGGGINNDGTLMLSNSTVSGNMAGTAGGYYGGGIFNTGTLTLKHSTVTQNITDGEGGGIFRYDGDVVLDSTILAGNMASGGGPDCSGVFGSSGHNLIGSISGCEFAAATGDLIGMDPNLGMLIGSPAYHHLLAGSPAIDAIPPSQCTLATDQRGAARPQGPACDIGSYEYTIPGPAATVSAFGGTPQRTFLRRGFGAPLQTLVLDSIGSPVNNAVVTLSAPASGASGTFADSGTASTTAVTNESGVATASIFTANEQAGSYAVTATAHGAATTASFLLHNIEPESAFLPCLARNFCPDFFDDFGDPTSGWVVVDDSYVLTQYLNGEYRVLTKRAGYLYLFRAPTCVRQNYVVEVDARWVGTPGGSYGLIFGISSDNSQYYLFDVNTDFRQYRLWRRHPGGFAEIAPVNTVLAIHGTTESNHLKVTRNGNQIILEVNGTVLGTWYDSAITGWTGAGLVTSPYSDQPTSDARFDNFLVVSVPSSAAAQGTSGGKSGMKRAAGPEVWREPAVVDGAW